MFYHYLSFNLYDDAKRAQMWARTVFNMVSIDRVQGASDPGGALYIGGKYWYVFHTSGQLSQEQGHQIAANVTPCGQALNTQGYW